MVLLGMVTISSHAAVLTVHQIQALLYWDEGKKEEPMAPCASFDTDLIQGFFTPGPNR